MDYILYFAVNICFSVILLQFSSIVYTPTGIMHTILKTQSSCQKQNCWLLNSEHISIVFTQTEILNRIFLNKKNYIILNLKMPQTNYKLVSLCVVEKMEQMQEEGQEKKGGVKGEPIFQIWRWNLCNIGWPCSQSWPDIDWSWAASPAECDHVDLLHRFFFFFLLEPPKKLFLFGSLFSQMKIWLYYRNKYWIFFFFTFVFVHYSKLYLYSTCLNDVTKCL